MAKRAVLNVGPVSKDKKLSALQDEGETGKLITRAIESAPSIRGGLLVTFRKPPQGENKHETVPAGEIGTARTTILNFMRAGLVPVC